jgi:ribonuclease HII
MKHAQPGLEFEVACWLKGFQVVAGLDEAGRGAWAGPVMAGAVVLPARTDLRAVLSGVRDSKLMTAIQRDFWAERIKEESLVWAVGDASHEEIDALGILPATRLAMQRAVKSLTPPAQHLLIDALRLPQCTLPQLSMFKGESQSLSIAAASVLAKTTRDAWMIRMEDIHPGFGFARHKGYGTAQHRSALANLGPCAIHRKTFMPMRELIQGILPAYAR